MAFITLEDLEGMLEAVVLPDVYRRYKNEVFSSQPMLLTGTVEMDVSRGEPMLRADGWRFFAKNFQEEVDP